MEASVGFGLCAVLVGGVLQGSMLVPMKFTRRWAWENTWAGFSSMAYLLAPWALALFLVSHFPALLWQVPSRVLITTLLFGVSMGIGALMMGVGYRYVGMAIAFAIVLGLSSSFGTLVPLLVLAPEDALTRRGISVMGGVLIALVGTAVVAWASWERDKEKKNSLEVQSPAVESARSSAIGLALCVSSGLLSSAGNLGFAFGGLISQKAREFGAGPTGSGSATWTVILLPVFLCNFIYSLYLLRKNQTAHLFREPGTAGYWGLAILMGALWMGGMASYAAGALSLGKLGTSMGWILFTSSMIIVSSVCGAITGEWKGSSLRTVSIMVAGVGILLLAVVVVGMAGASS